MSYCVFITRRAHTQGTEKPAIALSEWATVVDSDSDLENRTEYRTVLWAGLSSQSEPTFEWAEGEIVAHNPDTAQLTKMLELAARLSARVVTEEGDEIEETGDEEFDPTTAYDFDLEAHRRRVRELDYLGVKGFLTLHIPAVASLGGLAVVIGRAAFFDLCWLDFLVAFLAGGSFALYLYYVKQKRLTRKFEDWLLRNIDGLAKGAVDYQGVPLTLDTRVTRFSASYSFLVSHSDWSRWYFVGIDDRGKRMIHNLISIVFGSWGLPLGPVDPAMSVIVNLPPPGGEMLTVRNLCLRLDNALCRFIGRPDPDPRLQFKKASERG